MDIAHNLAIGFGAAATPLNLLFCLFGCLIADPLLHARVNIRDASRIGRILKR